VLKPLGVGRRATSLNTSFERFHDKLRDKSPPPGSYKPRDINRNTRYTNISFGIGERKLTDMRSATPGPGSYFIPSKFDKVVERYRKSTGDLSASLF